MADLTLTEAIAKVQQRPHRTELEYGFAAEVILNAVASGDLIPRADAELAVALVVEQAVMDLPKAVGAAAIKWCGEKDRETFQSDIEYFRTNWRALPGLRDYVLRALAPADGLAAVDALRKERDRLAADLTASMAREAELLAALEDPLVVHLNMVAGKIAKPLPSQLAHIYGEDVIRAALRAILKELDNG